MEEGHADVVHMNVISVTTLEVTPSLMLPSATQLDWASMPTIIEELVLQIKFHANYKRVQLN